MCGETVEKARNLTKQTNLDISIAHYLKNMAKLTNQFTQQDYKDAHRQRLYLKDIDCPEAWRKYLEDIIPSSLFYLNESTAQPLGPASTSKYASHRRGSIKHNKVAPAGDLMSSLPTSMRAENLMCYVGHEGTYTPAHREMCASLGHNIMVEASGDGLDLWGNQEKPGSSIWFMTETKDRHLVSEYWLSILGHDIEVEAHFGQLNAWKNAPFVTYIVEQKAGDFILIPPLAPHQVWNRGTRTMKVAWNRTTVETLGMAINEALPRARMVCRDEQYKNKAIIYFTLQKYAELLGQVYLGGSDDMSPSALSAIRSGHKVRQLCNDFRRLFRLFTDILLSESFSLKLPAEKQVQYLPYDSNVTCAYCRCNIFNRFLTCPTCIDVLEDGDEDAYDVCMECYAMGRSCGCISNLKWVEQFKWAALLQKYADWSALIVDMDGTVTEETPLSFTEARKRLPKKTLAQVCQEQLRIRPWRDINQALPSRSEEQGRVDVNDEGGEDEDEDEPPPSKRRKKSHSQKSKRPNSSCHICKHREVDWKLAKCKCGMSYCYGTLFRAFDQMPQEIMENPDWKCPHCLKICSCGQCRKHEGMKPYEPVGTLVGHDTKRVADPRSVESLVDFARSNLNWIGKNAAAEQEPGAKKQPYGTVRLRRLKEEAERQKAREETLAEEYVHDENDEDGEHDESNSADVANLTSGNSHVADNTSVAPGLTASQLHHEEGHSIDPMLLGDAHKESFYTTESYLDDADDRLLTLLRAEMNGINSRGQSSQMSSQDTQKVNKAPVASMLQDSTAQRKSGLGFLSM